jgi:DNA-directed RNA polymerase subunit RPC12/RpoP
MAWKDAAFGNRPALSEADWEALSRALWGPCEGCGRSYSVEDHAYGLKTCCPECSHDILAAEALLKIRDAFIFSGELAP